MARTQHVHFDRGRGRDGSTTSPDARRSRSPRASGGLLDRGILSAGDALPPVRVARRPARGEPQHPRRGLPAARRSRGHRLARPRRDADRRIAPPSHRRATRPTASSATSARGTRDPDLIPDPSGALSHVTRRPVLYGEPVIDPGISRCGQRSGCATPSTPPLPIRLTITSGASDGDRAAPRSSTNRDDAVATRGPVLPRQHPHRGERRIWPVAIPVDEEGMTVDGLRAALADGVRAVVCTPRAQNPTGASLSERRAPAAPQRPAPSIRTSSSSRTTTSRCSRPRPYHSLIGPDHGRWALIRSVSKFLGPDMCLAVAASDPRTADRLAMRLTPGTTWVSHLLRASDARTRDR